MPTQRPMQTVRPMSEDDAIAAAAARWSRPDTLPPMDSIGVVTTASETAIARRHGGWFDELIAHAGHVCRDGPSVAGLAVASSRDRAPIHVVAFHEGCNPTAHLRMLGQQVVQLDVQQADALLDRLVAAATREHEPIALPDDPILLAALRDRQRDAVRTLAAAAALVHTPRWQDVSDAAHGEGRGDFNPYENPGRFF